VKEEIVEIALTFPVKVLLFIASLLSPWKQYINNMENIDSREEATDLFIMYHTAKGDITVKQDIGLAILMIEQNL
jgi:uncharacterized protein YaiI (UPF0178 family)